MKRSKLTLLTYHRTTTHCGKSQRNLEDQQLLYHQLENKTEASMNKKRENQSLRRVPCNSLYTNNKNKNNEDYVESFLNASCQLSPPIKAFTPTEVHNIINLLTPHKAPGYDLITGALQKNLPQKAIALLTTIYNSMLRLCYFSVQWKYAQLIMIAKPGKPPTETNSCRPISLLPTLSKVFERLILKRLEETVPINDIIPMHQFGFQANHSSFQQCHRIVNKIKESMEGNKVCTSIFLDIQQAFDKVRHKGLLYKLKKNL
jgi:hypothetical protein